jgi:hypothetical protein
MGHVLVNKCFLSTGDNTDSSLQPAIILLRSGVRLSPLELQPQIGLLYQSWMIDV